VELYCWWPAGILASLRWGKHDHGGWFAPDGQSNRQKRGQLLAQGKVDLGAFAARENRRSHRPGLPLSYRLGIVPDHYSWNRRKRDIAQWKSQPQARGRARLRTIRGILCGQGEIA